MPRPFHELELRVAVLLSLPDEFRMECISIARMKSPSSAFDLACMVARKYGMDCMLVIGVAKATRWLAVIRRDYSEDTFNQVTRTLVASTPTT